MKKTKQILSVILSLAMLFSITAGFDFSSYADTSEDWEYELLDDGTAEITKYTGEGGDVIIPSTIDGFTVTKVWGYLQINDEGTRNYYKNAFSNCNNLTSIVIPKCITSLPLADGFGNSPNFGRQPNLVEINVDKDNMSYSSQDGVLFNKEKTELIQYPIGNERVSYNIPEGVTNLCESAFEYCDNLLNIIIPDSVTDISSWVFSKCRSLTYIEIPDSVINIKDFAFEDSALTNIKISKNITSIERTFFGCTNLKSVIIPNSITRIGYGAFQRCCCLENIVIPEFVTDIEWDAFSGCRNLKNISLPENLKNIYDGAFTNCDNLADVYYSKTISEWNQIAICEGNNDLINAKIHCTDGIINNEKHIHNWNNGTTTKKVTCITTGVKTYTCTECGETKIEVIPKTAHTYKTTTTKATTSKNGSVVTKCSVCGNVSKNTVIYYPKTITLSTTSYTYNGKVKKPSVTVKDSKGKKISSNNYTVSYSSGRKNVGQYTVTIKFKDNYSGTVKKTFTIKPKATTISKITAGKKAFTVKWKKQASQTTGYQIQYSTSSKFNGAKTVTVSKNKTTSKKISKLKAKKKYYVRVRTYKTVKVNGKNTKIYSGWSKVKTVKTK